MNDPTLLKLLIGDVWSGPLPVGVARVPPLPHREGKILSLLGMRQVGKSFRLFQEMSRLLADGIPQESLLYVNFEDDRLDRTDPSLVRSFVDALYAAFPENHSRTTYLFFDEVQTAPEWSLTLRRLLDTKRCHITVTGSSAKLLSAEIATELRGRALPVEVWPFCFQEFCEGLGVSYPYPLRSLVELDFARALLEQYLEVGGFPEVTTEQPAVRRTLLRGYVDTVILRDVVERHGRASQSFFLDGRLECSLGPKFP